MERSDQAVAIQHKDGHATLPRYQSHKKVWALKIGGVENMTITPADEGYLPFIVDPQWILKHKPEAGGYYVVYDDGYASFSPAKAFEEGYTAL